MRQQRKKTKLITKSDLLVIGLTAIVSAVAFTTISGNAKGNAQKGFVEVSTRLNVRDMPSTDSAVIGKTYPGDIVEVIGENGDFYNILYTTVEGKEESAYVAKQFITIPDKGFDENYELMAAAVVTKEHSSENRNFNMALACQKLNGLTLMPGEEFDWYFGKNGVGNASLENGFKEAPVLEGGVSVMGQGGGVCQVSTAMYNCILDLGIDEKDITVYHHSKNVGYVEYGKDATVTYSSKNFKFKNTTDYVIEFEAFTEGSRVIMLAYKVNLDY